MRRFGYFFESVLLAVVLAALGGLNSAGHTRASEIQLKDGRVLSGSLGMISSLADQPQASKPDGSGPLQLILFVDDDLRRTFVPKRQVQQVLPAGPAEKSEEKFHLSQRVPRGGLQVKSVGPVLKIQPFDEFGRRIFTFNSPRGPVDVIQGITLLTPRWAKVQGLSHLWDMRTATSSIPHETLHKILLKQIDPNNVDHHKRIARFYLQAERYGEARKALEAILKKFPDQPNLRQELQPSIRSLRQLGARRLLAELKLRRLSGQHRLVFDKLRSFPSENVAGEILQAVAEIVQDYQASQTRGNAVFEKFDALLPQVKDETSRNRLSSIRKELRRDLDIDTLPRMASFMQHADDPDLSGEEKLSLAVSGWLLGSDAALVKLPVSLSLIRVRKLVRQYLAEPVKLNRNDIFRYFNTEEGATPSLVTKLLAHMKPPLEPPEPISPEEPGYYQLEVTGLPKEPPVRYLVQLPPEYNPYRHYPTIVTLHGAGTTAKHQIDWWAGAWTSGGWRNGQATRHGYIVISPQWTSEHQKRYGYSARAHAAVLNSLRDACRHFAIDTDRVFLSGHSIGGDAAWDIALAHPDLWAGVIPIVAQADRYCAHYWENAKLLPFYFVGGELDGNKLSANARDLDRYMKRGYNCTVVEYLGRGHEHFYEEILELFDWMGRFRRDFFPRDFNCATMRPWDNFFWWIELEGMPPKSMVSPADWPPPRGALPMQIDAKITKNNGIYVRTGAAQVTVWVAPEMVDFTKRVNIVVNGRRINAREPFVQPDLHTLLEDARTRGDRQHPFWAKFGTSTGRIWSD